MKYYYHQKKENRHLCSQAFLPMKLQTVIIFVFLVSCLSGSVVADSSSYFIGKYQVSILDEQIEPIDDGKEIHEVKGFEHLLIWREFFIGKIGFALGDSSFLDMLIFFSPILYALLGFFVILRFASAKSRTPSPVPDKILSFLHEHNGSSQKQIIEAVSASRGSVSFHLKNLEKKGFLKVVRANGVVQYFLTSAAPASAEHAAVLRFLSRKKSGAALRMLFEQKEITRKELAGVLHISETTARWYLEQFVVCGLAVSREEEGGVYYCITKEAEDVLHNLISGEN